MGLANLINRILGKFNLAICKRSTLKSLLEQSAISTATPVEREAERLRDIAFQLRLDQFERKLSDVRAELVQHQIYTKWASIDNNYKLKGNSIAERKCPLCEKLAPESEFKMFESECIFEGGHLLRRQCPHCDVIFGADKMFDLAPSELKKDYHWHYRVFAEGDSTEQELRAFHSLKPEKSGIYLNYGAGSWSNSTKQLIAEGWKVFAYEPNDTAASNDSFVIQDRKKLSEIKFDGVFSNNVLEHLRYPVEELRFIAKLLKPQGRMAHATPCYEYLYEFTRFHLFFFVGRSKEVLANRVGMDIQEFISDGEFMNAIFAKKPS